MNSNGFKGNEKIMNRLGILLDSGRFPHAIILEGEQGIGKKTLARLIAAALVCRGEDKPCMHCTQCRKASENIHPDIFEYVASGAVHSFHVNTVRQIINDAYIRPNEADYKVYILGNADCMNESAQNAILKILEEPPAYAVFILTVQSKSVLLNTVLSRAVVLSLNPVEITQGANYIVDNMQGIDFDSAQNALKISNGNIGKAVESLQSSRSSDLAEVCVKICDALTDSDEFFLMSLCSSFQKDRQSVVFATEFLKNIFRDALVLPQSQDLISGQYDCARRLKLKLTKQNLVDLIAQCDELKKMAQMNINNALLITKICYALREAVGR